MSPVFHPNNIVKDLGILCIKLWMRMINLLKYKAINEWRSAELLLE
jgi:hypothetical protein